MIRAKSNQNCINDKRHLKRIIKPNYDAWRDLKRAELNLVLSLDAKGPYTSFITTPEEEAARIDAWYQNRLARIAREEQIYRQGVVEAEKSGAIDTSKAIELLMGLSSQSSINPFARVRREASKIYYETQNFFRENLNEN